MKKKILLVEYATSTIDIIKDILANPIFELTVASEGEEAKEKLEKKRFDLMITAAMLPKFHGFNLSQYASENYPGLKIIIVSEIYKGMDYRHQAITQYKADDFFEKPFDEETLKKRVFELLGLRDEDLKDGLLSTTMPIPISDTKKIPTFKKVEKEKKMSSEDLFGDIIDEVHDIPSYEINLGDNLPEEPEEDEEDAETAEVPLVTRKIETVTQVLKKQPPPSAATQKIDADLLDLLKKERKGEAGKQTQKLKKIEDDISKKYEDTLSGLGLGNRKAPAKKPVKETAAPESETDEVGGYEILGLIGRGGMAEIYKAKKKGVKGFEKVIALKKILSGYGTDVKFIEMFVDEAKIAADLSHPNIVQIYDLGKKDDYYFIAMEYVSGKDLRLILQKLAETDTTMPEEFSIYMVIKILEALNHAHSARDSSGKSLDIVHRDVSPPNILISYGGDIKLTDFGVSKASIKVHQTLAGALKGKLLYMSPEQARGEENIDHRSDLYSVGAILFELIAGKKLFMDSSEIAMLKKVQEGKIPNPGQIKKDIDPELESIILKALDKNIGSRYQKASQMIEALDAYMVKTYDHIPDASHIANFVYDLFKEEIIKEGLDINPKTVPYPIKRRKEEVPVKDKYESVETEKLKIKKEPQPEDVPEEDLIKDEEFRPIIEIDFDEDKNGVEEKAKKAPPGEPAEPGKKRQYEHVFANENDQQAKKKKNFLLLIIFIAAITVLAIVITILLLDNSSTEGNDAAAGIQPQGTKSMMTTSPGTLESGIEDVAAETGTTPATTGIVDTGTKPAAGDEISPDREKKDAVARPVSSGVKKDSQLTPGKKEKELPPRDMQPKTIVKKEISKPAAVPETKPEDETPAGEIPEKKLPGDTTKPVIGTEEKTPREVKTAPLEKKIVKEGDVLGLSEVDTQPVPVSTPLKITRSIRRLMISNQRVMVSFLVDHKGNVESVKLIHKSKMKKLNSLIIERVKEWKFKPATKDNKKVKVWKNKWLIIEK